MCIYNYQFESLNNKEINKHIYNIVYKYCNKYCNIVIL